MAERTASADVLVVGCGPGGAVLSYLLARSGVDVTLIERAATYEREYRGFGWNPGVVRLFDEMDVLEDVLELAHETVTEGAFTLEGERLTVLDFDLLDTAYPYALMMEQPALLERLVDRANAYEGFDFHPATTVTDIRVDESGAVRGVTARDREANESVSYEGRVVVGADGRYSTVRASAGIDPGFFDSPIDLVWFKLPQGAVAAETQARIHRDGIILYFGLGAGELQVGHLVPDGAWPSIREAGFDAFRDRVVAVDPRLGPAIDAHLDGFRDTTLLDIEPGLANAWVRDGLLLMGDAAHTASPIGAQGNPLAVEDAVAAHDRLVTALDGTAGTLTGENLRGFETARRPHVERVISLQRRFADNLSFWLDHGERFPRGLIRGLARVAGLVASRSGLVSNMIETFALGDRSVSVARRHFIDYR